MKGSIHFRRDRGTFFVNWYHGGKDYKITRYKGEMMYGRKTAQKLRALMQADVEKGVFRIEKYTGKGWTDVVPYLNEWLKDIRHTLSPATHKDYSNSIRNHLAPYFLQHSIMLHEIQYDTLMRLLRSINRKGKGKLNVMYCLRACLEYAWRSRRIQAMPPFPERRHYQIEEPTIEWLPEDRQMAIIEAIPKEHQPIFWWLKYHLRRPGEAMALHLEDYDVINGSFTIRRSVSARKVVNRTKTGAKHYIPCHPDFRSTADQIANGSVRQYFFVCRTSRQKGKRYTQTIMAKLWKDACAKVGESIKMYAGLKHSSCSQYINEKGLSISDLQDLTDHARIDSVRRYAAMSMSRKEELMARGRVVGFGKKKRKADGK